MGECEGLFQATDKTKSHERFGSNIRNVSFKIKRRVERYGFSLSEYRRNCFTQGIQASTLLSRKGKRINTQRMKLCERVGA